ncbi:helix-turn-helix domain-containing protein [Poseidonibacter lekithochrous]|uniref:helix-turn-helix domain-containing protein n=1 Tax=Poseidonibacter TaxID=2321187 RepID=UPI001C0A0252|nr:MULTISPECIES: helix-turn-helix domain-containing protein [Poseidonibacter]MBU3015590.1 helix-turn-helix domain-containing protein [Poseidonibacter lekithochrous]MDO6828889.1 helix-turn-helix domain-containing protein [Poseidonibacter sp. 1_MG-2023]
MPLLTIKLDISSDLQYRLDKKLKNKNKSIEEYLVELIENDFAPNINFEYDYYFNSFLNKLFNKEKEIELTKIEKKFFLYLLANQNKFCSSEEIKDNVWEGKNMSVFTLRNIINKIRAKTYYDIIKNRSSHGYKINIK